MIPTSSEAEKIAGRAKQAPAATLRRRALGTGGDGREGGDRMGEVVIGILCDMEFHLIK